MSTAPWKKYLLEDFKAGVNVFCCVYGIGTLGMPGNFARAGPIYATLALLFMAAANIFSSVAISRSLLAAPSNVKTFGDLGEWCFGPVGRWLTNLAQFGICLLVPCAFLVLGSILLSVLFPGALSPYVWIVIMTLSLFPFCLKPTLKETASAAVAGALGTVLADFISLGILWYYMLPVQGSIPKPNVTVEQVLSTFGNLSLAYGAGIVIPAIQRNHTSPTRVPRVVCITLIFISCLFLFIAVGGYSVVGCQIPGNLLFAVSGTALGFTADFGAVVIAFLAMQVHITIGFAVILHPALYICERTILGMHKTQGVIPRIGAKVEEPYTVSSPREGSNNFAVVNTAEAGTKDVNSPRPQKESAQRTSMVSVADAERDDFGDIAEYNKKGAMLKVTILRVVVIVLLAALACALHDKFLDLQDFVGALCVSVCCILLPVIFYLKIFGRSLPIWEQVFCWIIILVCAVAGSYATYSSAKQLFSPSSGGATFAFCPPEYQTYVYTNTTHYGTN